MTCEKARRNPPPLAPDPRQGGVLNPTVHISTNGVSEAALQNVLLVFDSLRKGFPTWRVIVTDNASEPALVPQIVEAAKRTGCEFRQLAARVPYHEFIHETVKRSDGPVIFCDTDIIFWDSVEGWAFPDGTVVGGRHIPEFKSGPVVNAERVHSCLLWVLDAKALREKMRCGTLEDSFPALPFRPFDPVFWKDGETGYVRDIGANILSALGPACHRFTDEENDCFDHLVGGTITSALGPLGMSGEHIAAIHATHDAAHRDPKSIRGVWRAQHAALTRGVGDGAPLVPPTFRWKHVSGLFGRYGVSMCWFDLPVPFVHVGLTDLQTGAFRYAAIPGCDDDYVETEWGGIELKLTALGDFHEYGTSPRPGGYSRHGAWPDATATVKLLVDGERYSGTGPAWVDVEEGHSSEAFGWTWISYRLEDGTRASRYTVEGDVTISGHLPDGIKLVPAVADSTIHDPWHGIRYTEALHWVLLDGKRIGYAYVEIVSPNSWGASRPTEREMISRWAKGDPDATACMGILAEGSQLADDFADGEISPRLASKAMTDLMTRMTLDLPMNPFWRRHEEVLRPVLLTTYLFWDASNDWARSAQRETRMFGYTYREMTEAVLVMIALLVGGVDHARWVLRELQWYFHTNRVEPFDKWEKEQGR